MGSITLPDSGVIGVDANIVISTAEKHPKHSMGSRPWLSYAAASQPTALSVVLKILPISGRNHAASQRNSR